MLHKLASQNNAIATQEVTQVCMTCKTCISCTELFSTADFLTRSDAPKGYRMGVFGSAFSASFLKANQRGYF
jgi:hypothetical protein